MSVNQKYLMKFNTTLHRMLSRSSREQATQSWLIRFWAKEVENALWLELIVGFTKYSVILNLLLFSTFVGKEEKTSSNMILKKFAVETK